MATKKQMSKSLAEVMIWFVLSDFLLPKVTTNVQATIKRAAIG
jgi:hypothetical protein